MFASINEAFMRPRMGLYENAIYMKDGAFEDFVGLRNEKVIAIERTDDEGLQKVGQNGQK